MSVRVSAIVHCYVKRCRYHGVMCGWRETTWSIQRTHGHTALFHMAYYEAGSYSKWV